MTIDQLVRALQKARDLSPLKGETVVTICRKGSGIPNATVDSVEIDTDGDGALVELLCNFEDEEHTV